MKKATSIRISEEAVRLLLALSKKLGLTKAALIELAIRKLAEREGVQ